MQIFPNSGIFDLEFSISDIKIAFNTTNVKWVDYVPNPEKGTHFLIDNIEYSFEEVADVLTHRNVICCDLVSMNLDENEFYVNCEAE